jgi:hypothetical protein
MPLDKIPKVRYNENQEMASEKHLQRPPATLEQGCRKGECRKYIRQLQKWLWAVRSH